jgi:F-type H+-transporting ATPase subunit b
MVVTAAWLFAAPAVAQAAPEGQARTEAEGAQVEGESAGGAEHEAAEPEGTPPINFGKLGLQLLNFAVLVSLLGFFGGKAINKALLARHEQLKADLVAASEARAAAEGRALAQEQRLASLEDEIGAIRAGIKEEAQAEKVRMIAAAEERAKRIQDETRFLLDQQVKEAEAQLKREVAEAAVKIAEQLVIKALNAGDQKRLVDTFITDVGTASRQKGSA